MLRMLTGLKDRPLLRPVESNPSKACCFSDYHAKPPLSPCRSPLRRFQYNFAGARTFVEVLCSRQLVQAAAITSNLLGEPLPPPSQSEGCRSPGALRYATRPVSGTYSWHYAPPLLDEPYCDVDGTGPADDEDEPEEDDLKRSSPSVKSMPSRFFM
jgi:hypothetical protein